MKKFIFFLSFIATAIITKAQVAINTNGNNPNASAMLDISSSNKGLLIPRVYLTSSVDNATIANPASSLLVYNTNINLSRGTGFYYNSGTSASPNWQPMQDLVLPFTKSTSDNGAAFTIANYSQNTTSSAIKAVGGGAGNALEVSGKMKIAGNGQEPAQGKVLTSDANGNATWEGAVAFSAVGVKGGGSQVIPHLVSVKIPFATEVYDLSGNYNDANTSPHSTFTAPVNGIYHFDTRITWANTNWSGYFELRLQRVRNGATGLLGFSSIEDVRLGEQSISIDVKLNAGDQVFVEVDHINSGNEELRTDNSMTYFNGRLITKL